FAQLSRTTAEAALTAGCGARLELAHPVRHAPAPGFDEVTRGGELIDALVGPVADVDMAGAIDGDAERGVELSSAAALDGGMAGAGADLQAVGAVLDPPTPGPDKCAARREFSDAVVVVIGDVDVTGGIDGDGVWSAELSCAAAGDACLAGAGADLQMVRTVCDTPTPRPDKCAPA